MVQKRLNNPKVTKKVLVFQKVARSCFLIKKLLKFLKVAEKLPSRIWIGLNIILLANVIFYTPNANMANYSVSVRDESHEGEASQSLMFGFYNASSEKSCFVVDLVCFILLCLRVAVSLDATRRDRNLPLFAS